MGVTFASSCRQQDWQKLILDKKYLLENMINRHGFAFEERMLIMSDVCNPGAIEKHGAELVRRGVLTGFHFAEDHIGPLLKFFQLKSQDFSDEAYWEALGILCAIYLCRTKYLLYCASDTHLKEQVVWIPRSIAMLEKKEHYKVAGLIPGGQYLQTQKESRETKDDFFVSDAKFSGRLFLVRTGDFRRPIYSEQTKEMAFLPGCDFFARRVFCFMKNHNWKKITYRYGSYYHN